MKKNAPLVLMILDGWGYNANDKHNAIASAHTPNGTNGGNIALISFGGFRATCRFAGCADGQFRSRTYAHRCWSIIKQDFTRINQAIKKGEFANNPVFCNVLDNLQKTGKSLHIMGLLSPGGVHSHEQHLFALLALCDKKQFNSVYLHLFLDGRDTPPQSALESLERLNKELQDHPVGRISSISGRYYAMDRDKRWERIEPVYTLLTEGKANTILLMRKPL